MLDDSLAQAPIIPLVQADDPATALNIVRALQEGGLHIMEVVLRTDAALDNLQAVAEGAPDAITGAGTVLSLDQAQEVRRRGAQFIVSPGLNDDIVRFCQGEDIPIFPGTVTATEVQRAHNLGLRRVKFFPANLSGGAPMLKSFSSVFRDMRFMPTGGVSPDNLRDYLSIPAVIACGGSWLTPADAIAAGDWGKITTLAKEAVALARTIRGS